MEMYRCKTQRIVNEFLGDEIALDECTAALAKALADVARRVGQEHDVALRILSSINNEIVAKELERRKMQSVLCQQSEPASTVPGLVLPRVN